MTDALSHAQRRFEANGLTFTPSRDDAGRWFGQCPRHRTRKIPLDLEPVDDMMLVHTGPCGCLPYETIRQLGLEHAAPHVAAGVREDMTRRRLGVRNAVVTATVGDPYERLTAALEAADLAGSRSDPGGIRGQGRYTCPACGALGDGHGLLVSREDSRATFHCFGCGAGSEILDVLELTWADIGWTPPPLDLSWIPDDTNDPKPTDAPTEQVDLLAGVRDGVWLDGQTFPALSYAVPGLIPEGFTLLVGPPKAGKSWLALAILLGIASGGRALGSLNVTPGRVLYLALEDGDRRMQDRCRTLMAGAPLPGRFCYVTRVDPGAILATIEAFLDRYPDTTLVVIDTLGKVMPPAMPNETTYSRDYRVGGRIKAIADARPGLALTALHHDRKAGSDDFVERVSGTNGLAGAADTIVVLSRARQSPEGFLAVTGRDVFESEYALTMGPDGSWSLAGSDLAESAIIAAQRHEEGSMSDRSAEILTAVRNAGAEGVRAAVLVDKFGTTVYEYLRRQVEAGRLHKLSRGLYVASESVRSVRNEGDDYETDLVNLTTNTSHTGLGAAS